MQARRKAWILLAATCLPGLMAEPGAAQRRGAGQAGPARAREAIVTPGNAWGDRCFRKRIGDLTRNSETRRIRYISFRCSLRELGSSIFNPPEPGEPVVDIRIDGGPLTYLYLTPDQATCLRARLPRPNVRNPPWSIRLSQCGVPAPRP